MRGTKQAVNCLREGFFFDFDVFFPVKRICLRCVYDTSGIRSCVRFPLIDQWTAADAIPFGASDLILV